MKSLRVLLIGLIALTGCAEMDASGPRSTTEILLTSEAGDRMASMANVQFRDGRATGTTVTVYPDSLKQTIDGIGSSFTESSAFVLAHLDPEQRRAVMRSIFSESGANFSLARTHIGSCDFSVEGKYSYAEVADDRELAHFSIDPDRRGFDPDTHAGIRDPNYDLLPMIQEALAIQREQGDHLKIVGSAWTAPPWMKDTEEWFVPASAENSWQGIAGSLKPQYVSTYADYLVEYLAAYAAEGVPLWALTPVNEPHGNGGHWESMNFTPESQNTFVNEFLGPRLRSGPYSSTKLLVYDQNRDDLENWTDVVFSDPRSAEHVYGVAVHWYESTFKVYEEAFERVHSKFPDYAIVHTEGCIDNLGNPAPGGIEDPEGFQEDGWFQNDAFWWNPTATDWAYTATWAGPAAADHPMYTPVHRYARNIIVSLDHWVTGWIDWNVVLDRQGGPNHASNFCGAPIMIDTTTDTVYYTPIYYVLAQFSRTIRPGDRAVQTRVHSRDLAPDDIHACATKSASGLLSVQLLNTTQRALRYQLQIAGQIADLTIPANAVQTVRLQL